MDTRKIALEYRLTHWARIMQERKDSGLCIKEYCEKAGFHQNIYYYWQRKLREAACEQLTKASSSNIEPTNFTEIMVRDTLSELPPTEAQLRIEISGVQITANSAYPAEKLSALLRELIKSC